MTDILQLPGWKVSKTSSQGEHLVIEAEYTAHPDSCQVCGLVGALYCHGPRTITFLDNPVMGMPSRLLAKVQRYKCKDCSGTFLQPLVGIDTESRMTERCLDSHDFLRSRPDTSPWFSPVLATKSACDS